MRYDNLFSLLKKRKIRRTELVKSGIVSAETMMQLRRNRPVSLHTLDRLSAYLECSIFDLMQEDRRGPS